MLAIHETFSNNSFTLLLFLISTVTWGGIWLHKNTLPKFKKEKLGILICVHSKDVDVDERIREDFIRTLKSSIEAESKNVNVEILVAPFQVASRFDNLDKAKNLLVKVRGNYLLFGLVRKRKNQHILDLTAYVRHKELTKDSQNKFAQNISSAWISRFKLNNADETFELFEISSEVVSLCSRYIIAVAALASNDFGTAEALLVNAKESIRKKQYPEFPAVTNIRKNIAQYLNEIYFAQIQYYFNQWNETGDNQNIHIVKDLLDKVFGSNRKSGQYYTLKAIIEVVLNNNYHLAETNMYHIKKKYRDVIWHLNIGFLKACQQDENAALKSYDSAIKLNNEMPTPLPLNKVSEFETFICWYIHSHPDKALPKYLLAVLNEYFKEDTLQAIEDYQHFKDTENSNFFPKSFSKADVKLKELS